MSLPDELTLTLESKDFPCDDLRIHRLEGTERIGRLFDLRLDVVCAGDAAPDVEAMAGARVTLVIERSEAAGPGWHGARRIHGILAEVDDLLAVYGAHRVLRLRIVPRAFLLGMVQTHQIFMGRTVPEIIRHKLDSIGLGETVDLRLHAAYPAREFVVQYKETDLAFVSRLAEHAGVSFFFEHDDDGDRIVWSDQNSGFNRLAGAERLAYHARGDRQGIYELEAQRRIVPAFYVVSDYNYRMPHVDLTSTYELPTGFAGGVVDLGSHFKTPAEGDALVRIRAEERQSTQLVYVGRCFSPVLTAGGASRWSTTPPCPISTSSSPRSRTARASTWGTCPSQARAATRAASRRSLRTAPTGRRRRRPARASRGWCTGSSTRGPAGR
jgi:type VI secretion system secreted protein VgrG